jgi:hypothetical protein
MSMLGHTSSLNVLDFPTVVIPVTFADKRVDLNRIIMETLQTTDVVTPSPPFSRLASLLHR